MQRYDWNHLNKQQVGAYAEYFVKMEFTMHGFQVYRTEVDDRGIDFVVRYERGPFLQVQVKALRSDSGYVFLQKSKFQLADDLYLALGLLLESQPPKLYLIPSTVWLAPNTVFVSRDYEGLKSLPEWGLTVSRNNLAALEQYDFGSQIARLVERASWAEDR